MDLSIRSWDSAEHIVVHADVDDGEYLLDHVDQFSSRVCAKMILQAWRAGAAANSSISQDFCKIITKFYLNKTKKVDGGWSPDFWSRHDHDDPLQSNQFRHRFFCYLHEEQFKNDEQLVLPVCELLGGLCFVGEAKGSKLPISADSRVFLIWKRYRKCKSEKNGAFLASSKNPCESYCISLMSGSPIELNFGSPGSRSKLAVSVRVVPLIQPLWVLRMIPPFVGNEFSSYSDVFMHFDSARKDPEGSLPNDTPVEISNDLSAGPLFFIVLRSESARLRQGTRN